MTAFPLLLRLDADHETGMGHGVRTRNLLSRLKTPLRLAVAGRGEVLAQLFPDAHRVEGATPQALEQAAAAIGARACLSDPPRFDPDAWRTIKDTLKLPAALIDDFGGPFPADLVINGTVIPDYHSYPAAPAGAKLLCGPAYALIHPAFGLSPWEPPEKRRVAIVVGGGDRALAWARMLFSGSLDLSSWGEVVVVFGNAFPAFGELQSKAQALGAEARRGLSSEELAMLLAGSSAALVTGGMVAYECMAVGVPTVVFPQVENLIGEAAWFAAQGCAIDLGFDGGLSEGAVAAAVGELLGNGERALSLSRRARSVVDGRGMDRAAAALDDFLAEIR